MTSSLDGFEPGNDLLAARLTLLSNSESCVVRAIKKNCGPSAAQIGWAVNHPPNTPPHLVALLFTLEIGRRDRFDLQVNIDGQFFIGTEYPKLVGTMSPQTLYDLAQATPHELGGTNTFHHHVFISYDTKSRVGHVTLTKQADAVIGRYLQKLNAMSRG
jgi:hypothetical protein